MYKVILTLDEFFLKYEGGLIDPPLSLTPEETAFKKPNLIRVKVILQFLISGFIIYCHGYSLYWFWQILSKM